ncbi:hypothetical protein SK128_024443 [Halocaridina rubra]|uniref:Uncharacterized protein n=1 Tax=Halocaridina rubra TaxID=373956 RepID=A0AAN8WR87_HALRR
MRGEEKRMRIGEDRDEEKEQSCLFAKAKTGMLRSCNGGDNRDSCNYYPAVPFQDSRENSFT